MKGVIITVIIVGILLITSVFYITMYNQSSNKISEKEQVTVNQNQQNPSKTTQPSNTQQNPASTSQTARNYNIDIKNFAFSPNTITIKAGDKVTWTNQDSAPHTITSDSNSNSNSGTLNSQTLDASDTYTYTFNDKRIYNYHCSIHSGMKGTIIVE